MDAFMTGFGSELVKTAKYPISRFLSSRLAGAAGSGADYATKAHLVGAGLGPIAALGGLGAGIGLGAAQLRRVVGGRAAMGRLARGGKGLMVHEKKRLAEAAGVTLPELEKVLVRVGKKGGKTYPVSRAISTKYNPLMAIERIIGSRGFAGRAGRGGKAMTGREKQLLEALMAEKKHGARIKGLKRGAATMGALAGGTALGASFD